MKRVTGAVLIAMMMISTGCGPRPREGTADAVVLVPRAGASRLLFVDVDAGRITRSVTLRSTATDIAVDASTGLVVAAQAGGLGADADDAVSLTEPGTGDVRYVELPCTNPGEVACADGVAIVRHGFAHQDRMVVTSVDPVSGQVIGEGSVPEGPGMWAVAGGNVWVVSKRDGSVVGVDRSAAPVRVIPCEAGWSAVGCVAFDGGILVHERSGAGAARLRLIDPASGSCLASRAADAHARGPQQVVRVGGRLIVGSWSGDVPESRALAVYDAATLRTLRSIRVAGVPCALASYRGRLLVVDRAGGRLLVVDPADGSADRVVPLGTGQMVFSDVIALPADARRRSEVGGT